MRTGLILLSLFAAMTLQISAEEAVAPKTEDQKMLYTVGVWLGQQAAPLNIGTAEFKYVQAGLNDFVQKKKLVISPDVYGPKLNDFAHSRMQARADVEKKKAKGFLDQAAKEKGAVKTASGLIYFKEKPGAGASPKTTDKVRVHYEGKLTDGTVFDSSIARGSPVDFPLNQVIPCWTEGVQKMKVGGKAKLVCPSEIAYGDTGKPPVIPGGATLVFQVDLLDILK